MVSDADAAPEGCDDCEEVDVSDMSDDDAVDGGEVGQDHGGAANHVEIPNDGDSQMLLPDTFFEDTLVDDNRHASGEVDMAIDETAPADESMPSSQLVAGEPECDDDDDDVICTSSPVRAAENIISTRKSLEDKISELHVQLSHAKKLETAKTFGRFKFNINPQTNSYSYM